MPKNNFLVFIVVTALLIGGWWWLQTAWLQKPADNTVAQSKGKKDSTRKEEPKEQAKDEAKEQPKKDEPKEQAKKLEEPKKVEEVVRRLGDVDNPSYYILATITNKGAGIRDLTLPKFKKADWNGRPVYTKVGKPAPLQLIEEDFVVASFLMYHYPVPEKDVCVTTLGQMMWKIDPDRTSTTAELSTVALICEDIPGLPDLRITKVYSLQPREYHITLNLRIEDTRNPQGTDKEPRPFQFQLAGSHGMPIEGEWYSPVLRTPMIGILNESNYLERNLTETQALISMHLGGDKVPLGSLGTSRIQYLGVDTQYFSSLIVVDTERGEQGKRPRPQDVFAYCRATLESEEKQGTVTKIDRTNPERVRLVLAPKGARTGPKTFVLLPRAAAQLDTLELQTGESIWVGYYDPVDGSDLLVATYVRRGGIHLRQLEDITVRGISNVLELKPGKQVEQQFLLYHGPAKVSLLSDFSGDMAVDPALVERYLDTLHLNTLTDYRSAGFFGTISSTLHWTDILILATRFMHWLLYWLHYLLQWLVSSYGLSILLLTLLVRGAMFPVSRRSALLSMRMQAIAPEMRKLQEKYKDDPQAKTAAIMELYRKHGVNPFGSCLPMVLQMPFFLGLYYCLQESIHFRLASFLWIDNLAAPDMLIYWGNNIPIISDPDNMSGSFLSFLYLGPYFNILPVIAVTLMLVQQKMMTPPPADEQQEMQQKMMKYMFVFIGIMFYKVAAGLCLYFIMSSLWGLCERKMLPKKPAANAATVATSAAPAGGGNPARGKGKPAKKEKKPDTAMQKVKDWWAEVLKQAQKK
jgi:YidC/Oxa1 family membrane protein insertase